MVPLKLRLIASRFLCFDCVGQTFIDVEAKRPKLDDNRLEFLPLRGA